MSSEGELKPSFWNGRGKSSDIAKNLPYGSVTTNGEKKREEEKDEGSLFETPKSLLYRDCQKKIVNRAILRLKIATFGFNCLGGFWSDW